MPGDEAMKLEIGDFCVFNMAVPKWVIQQTKNGVGTATWEDFEIKDAIM